MILEFKINIDLNKYTEINKNKFDEITSKNNECFLIENEKLTLYTIIDHIKKKCSIDLVEKRAIFGLKTTYYIRNDLLENLKEEDKND